MKDFTTDIIAYFDKVKKAIEKVDVNQVNNLMNLLIDALQQEKQIFIMGNGGSAATASHFACDFNKGLSWNKQKRFKIICLNDNIPTLMAYSNDISYEEIFAEPLKNFFQKGDLIVGLSGSGNSKNILNAIEWGNENGGTTIGLTGYDGGKLKQIAKHCVHIDVQDMQVAEDLHMILDHCMMQILHDYLK
ncbi:SIS domain-containing protein [Bacteroidales bacterium OttesenSCG-928-I21]|nr:SIS domain-containing protein [Bacteroidales bacterium OttesenSCG-928-I21]